MPERCLHCGGYPHFPECRFFQHSHFLDKQRSKLMSPRPDPLVDQKTPWDHCQQRKVADQLANLFKAVAELADGLTANTGEIAALRRAVDGSQARAEVNRLNAKRRYAMEKPKCDKSSSS